MSFIEDLWPWLGPPGFLEKYRLFKDSLLQSMANTSCGSAELKAYRDESAAFVFKLIVVASILLAIVVGVTIPLVSKNRSFLHTDGSFFVVAKAFAARVILATGFVHMLSKRVGRPERPVPAGIPLDQVPLLRIFHHDGLACQVARRLC
ncbi:hypothetical protein ACFXTH_001162 [Malus domestica]